MWTTYVTFFGIANLIQNLIKKMKYFEVQFRKWRNLKLNLELLELFSVIFKSHYQPKSDDFSVYKKVIFSFVSKKIKFH